jgi:hypothetical protein
MKTPIRIVRGGSTTKTVSGTTTLIRPPLGPAAVGTFPLSRLHRGADQFDAWIEFYGKDALGAAQTFRWAPRDLSDASSYHGGRKDGRLLSWGRYDLSLSDRTGRLNGTTLSYAIADIDKLVGGWLSNSLQATLPGVQNVIRAVFESDRLAALDPAVIFRGLVRSYGGPAPYKVAFSGLDWLSARIAPDLPMAKVGTAFPGCPVSVRARVGPIWYGANSDEGSSAAGPVPAAETASGAGAANPGGPCGIGSLANGVSVPTGGALVEQAGGTIASGVQVYVQYWKVVGGVAGDPDAASFAYGSTGVNVTTSGASKKVKATCTDDGDGATYYFAIGIYSGSAGHVLYNQILSTTTPATGVVFTDLAADGSATPITAGASYPTFTSIQFYTVTAVRADGETVITTYWVSVVSPYRRPTRVVWTPVSGALSYNVYRRNPIDAAWGRVWTVPTSSTNGDGNLVFNDDQLDTDVAYIDDAPTPKGVVPGIPIGAMIDLTGATWQGIALAAHAGASITSLYLRDSDGVATRVDDGRYGVDFAAPGKTGFATYWPKAYYDGADGTRWWLIYARGPDGDAIAAGTKTIWANGTGVELKGDGTSTPLLNGPDQLAHLLDNYILPDAPYRGGLWGTTPLWADGASRRDTASFIKAQTDMAAALTTGTARAFVLTEAIKQIDLLGQLMLSFDCSYGFTKAGQFRLVLEGPFADLTPVASFTELGELVADSFKWEDRTDPAFWWNALTYSYQPNYSASGGLSYGRTGTDQNTTAQAVAGVINDQTTTQFLAIRPAAMAAEIARRRLARASKALRTCMVVTGVNGLTPEIGDIVALTTREYPAPGGCTNLAMQVRKLSPDLDGLTVQLECWEARRRCTESTSVFVPTVTAVCNPLGQVVVLTSEVSDSHGDDVLDGRVTFTVSTNDSVQIGTPATAQIFEGIDCYSVGDRVRRTRGYLTLTSDWTRLLWVKEVFDPGIGLNNTVWILGDESGASPYVRLRTDISLGYRGLAIRTYDGTTTLDSAATAVNAIIEGVFSWAAVRYTAAAHTLDLIQDGAIVATLSVNLSTFVFTGTNDSVGGDTTAEGGIAVTRDRVWQAALTLLELAAEAASRTPVRLTSLLANAPLETDTDLTDHSGNGHDFAVVGAVYADSIQAAAAYTLPLGTC